MLEEIELPQDIQDDIDKCFCYMDEVSYQSRAHGYIADKRIQRSYNDTAVQCVVLDIAKRAYLSGRIEDSLGTISNDIIASLYETAGKMLRLANEMGE